MGEKNRALIANSYTMLDHGSRFSDTDILRLISALDVAEGKLERLRAQAGVPHAAFDNPANMIIPIRMILDE